MFENIRNLTNFYFFIISYIFYFQDGETPLHVACRQGDIALVSLLLDNYADPNAQNKV